MEKDFILRKVIRIILVGYYAGKTAFFKRYLFDQFDQNYLVTFGIEKGEKIFQLSNGREIKLILWDTAGNEILKCLAFDRVKVSDGVIIMYDITNRGSFEDALDWINKIRNYKNDFPVIIIGNKVILKIEELFQKMKVKN